MKYFFILTAFLAPFCSGLHAQSAISNPIPLNVEQELNEPVFVSHKTLSSPPNVNAGISFTLDYDSADAFAWGAKAKRSLWRMNKYFTATDKLYQTCMVAFDSLYDVLTDTNYGYSGIASVTVDSIFTYVGQENNSGVNDTLRVNIIAVDAVGYPMPTVLWTKDLIIKPGTPLTGQNQWNYVWPIKWTPAYTLAGAKKFAVQIEYFGAKIDTMAFLASFHPRTGNCGTNPNSLLADPTLFSPVGTGIVANSFMLWSQYGMQPPQTGQAVFYDCNANGTFQAGVDGANYIQNILIQARVTITPGTGTGINTYLSANGLKLMGAYPNPANDFITIRCRIDAPTNISVDVFDLMGRVVAHSSEKLTAGNHDLKISLKEVASGNYYYTVRTEGAQLTSKFVVIK